MLIKHRDTMERLAAAAIAGGGHVKRPGFIAWDIAGRCERSIHIPLQSRPQARPKVVFRAPWSKKLVWKHAKMAGWWPGRPRSIFVDLEVKCRTCAMCLRDRQIEWSYRAKAELAAASRTWFGTLTINPAEYHRALSAARHNAKRAGFDYESMTEIDRVKELHKVISDEITKWLKRIRQYSGADIRILIVAEVGTTTGRLHYHALVHERGDTPVRYATLRKQWRLGHSQFRIASEVKEATYLCKYLAKSKLARVRASLHYGKGPVDLAETGKKTPALRRGEFPDGSGVENGLGFQGPPDPPPQEGPPDVTEQGSSSGLQQIRVSNGGARLSKRSPRTKPEPIQQGSRVQNPSHGPPQSSHEHGGNRPLPGWTWDRPKPVQQKRSDRLWPGRKRHAHASGKA